MDIAEVVATFPPEFSGIGNVCYDNSVQLARMGNNVTVFTTECKLGDCELPKSAFRVVRLKPLVRYGNAPILPQLMSIRDADVIHLHLPFFFGSDFIYALHKLSGVPYIVTYHHDPLLKFPLNIVASYYNYSLIRTIDSANGVLVTSLDYAYNCRLRKKFAQIKRLRELPISVDVVRFNPNLDREFMRKKLRIGDAETIILFVGVLDRPHYFKGLQYLLSAFSKLNQKGCRLLIIGEGELKPQFVELASKLGVGDSTIFLGRVSEEELPLLYASSDFLVLPSYTMSEAFGKVVIEAMACGKPVIVSNLPGVRSIVSPWKDGLYVEPANVEDLNCKMKYLIENPSLRKKFGTNGRRKVESKYSLDSIGQRLDISIKEMINYDLHS
jgi:glycosyltransferase involved in cell wall biosynthesis